MTKKLLLSCISADTSCLFWRYSIHFLKNSGKVAAIDNSHIYCNPHNRILRCLKLYPGPVKAVLVQVLHWRHLHSKRKTADCLTFTDICRSCNILKINFFKIIGFNIFHHLPKSGLGAQRNSHFFHFHNFTAVS